MLDEIQFLLSMQIIGLCVLGGLMMLLRAFGDRARLILGWSMLMWAVMACRDRWFVVSRLSFIRRRDPYFLFAPGCIYAFGCGCTAAVISFGTYLFLYDLAGLAGHEICRRIYRIPE